MPGSRIRVAFHQNRIGRARSPPRTPPGASSIKGSFLCIRIRTSRPTEDCFSVVQQQGRFRVPIVRSVQVRDSLTVRGLVRQPNRKMLSATDGSIVRPARVVCIIGASRPLCLFLAPNLDHYHINFREAPEAERRVLLTALRNGVRGELSRLGA